MLQQCEVHKTFLEKSSIVIDKFIWGNNQYKYRLYILHGSKITLCRIFRYLIEHKIKQFLKICYLIIMNLHIKNYITFKYHIIMHIIILIEYQLNNE